jgi:hypothetical protein
MASTQRRSLPNNNVFALEALYSACALAPGSEFATAAMSQALVRSCIGCKMPAFRFPTPPHWTCGPIQNSRTDRLAFSGGAPPNRHFRSGAEETIGDRVIHAPTEETSGAKDMHQWPSYNLLT